MDDEEQSEISSVSDLLGLTMRILSILPKAPVECSWQGADYRNQKPGGQEPSKAKYGNVSAGSPFSWLCGSKTSGSDEAVLRRNFK